MAAPSTSLEDTLQLLYREGKRRVISLTVIFSLIALSALAFGVLRPRMYEAHSVILLEASNISTPLMERAASTGVSGKASILNQTLFSSRILREILAFGGRGEQKSPREEARAFTELSGQIRIDNPGPGGTSNGGELIEISYVDQDPRRCYEVAKKLAEIYVRESMSTQERESRQAFDFIDNQVNEYGAKVSEAHAKVLAHYNRSSPKARPARPPRPKLSAEEISALRAEETALVAELERHNATAEARQFTERREDRLRQLQGELDRLRETLTDEHPDVKSVLEELQRTRAEAAPAVAIQADDAGATRVRLREIRKQIAAANKAYPSRATQGPTATSEGVPDPELRGVGQDPTQAELVRSYETTRDVYQDLLKRREDARVAMEVDAENRGLTPRIQAPPELPSTPLGMGLVYTALIGLALALLVPLGVLFAVVHLDPRVRSARQIESAGLVPLLVCVPYASQSKAETHRRLQMAAAMVACVFLVYAVFLVRQS